MPDLAPISAIINSTYVLYCFALGIWAGILYLRDLPLSGNFWGAMWLAPVLPAIELLLGIIRAVGGAEYRTVFWLYQIYFIIVLPGTFALLRGRDDRQAAAIFAGIAIFSALAAISTAQRNVILNPALILGLW
ncbi:MAG: hypothetical protein U0528_13280 [Anaerolineae bacterium]|nr:hypothetical protein [Anaerolineae bacterium]